MHLMSTLLMNQVGRRWKVSMLSSLSLCEKGGPVPICADIPRLLSAWAHLYMPAYLHYYCYLHCTTLVWETFQFRTLFHTLSGVSIYTAQYLSRYNILLSTWSTKISCIPTIHIFLPRRLTVRWPGRYVWIYWVTDSFHLSSNWWSLFQKYQQDDFIFTKCTIERNNKSFLFSHLL